MEQNKFFSIIIPTYNSKKIKPTYDSIEKQTAKEFIEVIIVDDNSAEDAHLKMLEDYTFDYKIIKNTESLGPGMSRQVGVDNCTGQWMTFLDHDDEFINGSILSVIKRILETETCHLILDTQIITAYDYDYNKTGLYNIIMEPAWLHGKFFKRETWLKYNLAFNPNIKASEDTYIMNIVKDLAYNQEMESEVEDWYVKKNIITYVWYLFENSTSHTKKDGYTYLENTFEDFIKASYDSLMWIDNMFHKKEIWQLRFYSLIIQLYFYYEKYNSLNTALNNPENDVRKLSYQFLREKLELHNLTIEEVIDFIYRHPSIYKHWYLNICEGEQHGFVPSMTVKEFLLAYDTIV